MSNSHEVITFKADKELVELLRGISNRSEFIRSSILSALDKSCPFCKGTGVLTSHKRIHLDKVTSQLEQVTCKECDECEDPREEKVFALERASK